MSAVSASVLAILTFGAPVLVWGLLAITIPLIIHLVLRQRPRREVLPTLRFLLKAHQNANRAHRIKHIILLACRMAAILLIVGLLMKTGCAPAGADRSGSAAPTAGPVSAVIVIDDSASMQYRYQGRTRLEDARAWAAGLIADTDRFPAGSEFAVIAGSADPAQPVGWSRDATAMTRLISEIQPGWHDRSVAALLRQAYAALAGGLHIRPEVYVFTDLTETSWREPLPDPPKRLARIFVLDLGRRQASNLAITGLQPPANMLSANQPGALEVKVRSTQTTTPGAVTLNVDGQPRDRHPVQPPQADSESTLNFTIPALPEGPHEILLELEPDDPAPFDNRRFACISVGSSPAVVVVGDEGGGTVASMISAMIAPPALPTTEQRFALQRLTGPALASARFERALAVILADPAGLTPGGWQALERYVSAGGTLLLIPGPNTTPEAYTGQDRLLPATIKAIYSPPEPITLAAANLTHPYLKPFADTGLDSINDRLVYLRLDLAPPAAAVSVIAAFSDQSPAILEAHPGPGRVLQFAFSPDRDWSQLGTQAGPMIVLMHSILESFAPRPENIELVTAGRLITHKWPTPGTDYTLKYPDGQSAALPVSDGISVLPSERPGHYRVSADAFPSQTALLYGVNVADSESELNRITDEAINARFPAGMVFMAHDPADLPSRHATTGRAVSWTVPLALAIFGLLWFETFFANRFYSRNRSGYPVQSLQKPDS